MIYHSKILVLVRKGCAFYETLYQEVFFWNPGGVGSLSCIKFDVEPLIYKSQYYNSYAGRGPYLGFYSSDDDFAFNVLANAQMDVPFTQSYAMF